MKLLRVLTLLLVALVACTSAQCPEGPREVVCSGRRNVGRGGRRCRPRNMWYFDSRTRQCREMRYLGCSGNNNRFCNRAACEQKCLRRG